jgi:hypothetical protein
MNEPPCQSGTDGYGGSGICNSPLLQIGEDALRTVFSRACSLVDQRVFGFDHFSPHVILEARERTRRT